MSNLKELLQQKVKLDNMLDNVLLDIELAKQTGKISNAEMAIDKIIFQATFVKVEAQKQSITHERSGNSVRAGQLEKLSNKAAEMEKMGSNLKRILSVMCETGSK